MSNKYYRGIRNSIKDTKYELQLASMSLKINENKNDIDGIKSNVSGINDFSDNIRTNTSNIKSNFKKIYINKSDITSNLGKISNNFDKINDNSEKINDIGIILPSKIVFDKKYKLKNRKYNFNSNSHFFKLLEIEIKHDFRYMVD